MKIYQLEVTNYCNLECSFCPNRYGWSEREKGLMELDLIERIDFSDTKYVELQFGGESMIHPLIHKIREQIQKKGVMVGLASNGSRKDFNYDGFDMVTITRDCERDILDEHKDIPNLNLQILGEDYPYEDYSHTKIFENGKYKTCITPFEYVSIHWDGDVVPCCKCFGKQHVFGNLYDLSFEEIINSNKREKFLEKMVLDTPNYICKYCDNPNPHLIHKKILDKIKKRGDRCYII